MGKREGGNNEVDTREGVNSGNRGEEMAMINMNRRDWRSLFNILDRNGNGVIELKEIRSRLNSANVQHGLSNDEMEQVLRKADRNRDKQLNYEEFAAMMNSPDVPEAMKRSLKDIGMSYVKWAVPMPVGRMVDRRTGIPIDTVDARSYMAEYNCNPPPLFIFVISIIELGVFIYYAVTMGSVTASGPVPYYSPFIYNPHRRYEAWRYFSYMLIHSGYAHITFNLLMQLLLGVPLEMVHKWWRVAIIYFAGVIAGSLGTSISDPSVYLAGASAGDYAIITAHLSTVILNWKEMEMAWLQLLFLVIIMGTDVGVAVYNRYAMVGDDRTGYAAHLAGAIAGLLVGIGVLRNLEVRSWENKLWWASLILFGTLILIAIIWNAAFPSYFPEPYYN